MNTPDDGREAALALMRQASDAMLDGVARLAAGWVVHVVTTTGGAELEAEARRAGQEASVRVLAELRALFALPPERQRATPLEIVRSLRREATAVLHAAGVPPIARDPFEVRAFPDDVYGIVPRSLADLGDDDLGPLLLAWGMGKSRALAPKID